MYQLDVVKGTLGLLESRITQNESNLVEMMNFIRNEDVVYVSSFSLFQSCAATADVQTDRQGVKPGSSPPHL